MYEEAAASSFFVRDPDSHPVLLSVDDAVLRAQDRQSQSVVLESTPNVCRFLTPNAHHELRAETLNL